LPPVGAVLRRADRQRGSPAALLLADLLHRSDL
jgi:hypothetical protein